MQCQEHSFSKQAGSRLTNTHHYENITSLVEIITEAQCLSQHTPDTSTVGLLLIFQTSDDLSLNVERYSQLIKAAFCNSKTCILHLGQITCRQRNN